MRKRNETMQAEQVVNKPGAAWRARVDCVHSSQSSSQTGFIDKPISSQTTGASARTREGRAAIRCREAYFRAWRIAKFGGDFDPIAVAVDEAVAAFSSGKGADGQAVDRAVWLKIANRAGLSGFIDAFDQKASELHQLALQGRRLWNPAASFQKLLNKCFPKPEEKGGAR
jgi:hypothetical protein